jgi:hypothetical protein
MGITRDNRTAKRIPLATGVDLRVQGRSEASGRSVNLSMGGLFLTPGGLLPVGSACEVAIALPAGSGRGIVVAEGTVVRSGNAGTAIRFMRSLGEKAFGVLAGSPPHRPDLSWLDRYQAYFRAGQGKAGVDFLETFGVSRRTFLRVSAVTFILCIACALLVAWLSRAWIVLLPAWAQVVGALVYGMAWLLVLQPAVDLAVIRLLHRGRNRQ